MPRNGISGSARTATTSTSGSPASSRPTWTIRTRHGPNGRPSPITGPWSASAGGSPAWSPRPGCGRPASTSGSSRRAAASAGPGTGTGTPAGQCVPHLARDARELYVFQRTPSSVDTRGNHPIDPAWFAEIATPGWQQRWLENFTANQAGGAADEDLVQDGWTDIARRIRARIGMLPPSDRSLAAMLAAYEESDFEKMEEIRARADAIVRDRGTAHRLKAWYRQLCKRPCFHDEYLQAFNSPN